MRKLTLLRSRRARHRSDSERTPAWLVALVLALAIGAAGVALYPMWSLGMSSAAFRADEPAVVPSPSATPSAATSPAPPRPAPPAQADPPAVRVAVPAQFPDRTTTGVPDGVSLRQSGSLEVTEDGAVVENLLIVDGDIEVWADDVTIRNVRITSSSEDLLWGILQRSGHSGLVVEDSEIFGGEGGHVAAGITNHGGMITIRRVEIYHVSDAVNTETGLLADSYLHSPAHVAGDHNDMVQANGGAVGGHGLRIVGNTIINDRSQTGAISLFDNFSAVRDVVIERNFLAGGGYTIYGGGTREGGSDPTDIVIRDNVFSREIFDDGGFYGPVAHFDRSAPGNVWSGNVWHEDGSPVRV